MSEAETLKIEDFAELFDTRPEQMPSICVEMIRNSDFRYRRLSQSERDQVLLKVTKRIESKNLTLAGKEGRDRWEKGWNENLDNFVKSGYKLSELVPKYIRPDQVIRIKGDYAVSLNPNFELDYYNVLRYYLYQTYLGDISPVYEFGCGTGYNLVELAKLYPDKELHGLDWISAPKEILRLLKEKYGYNLTGHVFDMFEPEGFPGIKKNSGVLALASLEQTGTNFRPFISYILKQKPKVFIQVDSLMEMYDEDNLFDYLAVKFTKRRRYLEGYIPYLEELEKEGKIEIIKIKRAPFGSLFHDYGFVVWRPGNI